MSLKVRAKILNIIYNRENNLFKLTLKEIGKNENAYIAIKGTDWGVMPDTPEDIVNKFCEDMKGKEKNLFIEEDSSSMKNIEKGEDGTTSEQGIIDYFNKLNKYPIAELAGEHASQAEPEPIPEPDKIDVNLNNYPIDKILNLLHEDVKKDED